MKEMLLLQCVKWSAVCGAATSALCSGGGGRGLLMGRQLAEAALQPGSRQANTVFPALEESASTPISCAPPVSRLL